MAEGHPTEGSGDERQAAPRWRGPLLVVVLCLAVFALFWVFSRAKNKDRAAEACFKALFSNQVGRALEIFQEYREFAKDDVPSDVRDDFLRLKADRYKGTYPIYTEQVDEEFLDRTVFFCLASDYALTRAKDQPSAALRALLYAWRNVQSGGHGAAGSGLDVNPLHVLYRGYGNSVQHAWVMASLLRYQGMHAAVILLRDSPQDDQRREGADGGDKVDGALPATGQGAGEGEEEPYAIVGVVGDRGRRLYLFDPYRAVPICRASDRRIADLQTLLSGEDGLAPGLGGPETPVTVARLRNGLYLVPTTVVGVLPDGFLLQQIIRQNRQPYVVHRSFREDLRNLASVVFGQGAETEDRFTSLKLEGQGAVVRLWNYPFLVASKLADRGSGYFDRLTRAHRAMATIYLKARQAQLLGNAALARTLYDDALAKHPDDAEAVEDIRFFKASLAPAEVEEAPDEDALASVLAGQVRAFTEYLRAYPSGRWRPLATLLLAELQALSGNAETARDLAAQLKGSPYALRARLLTWALRDGKRRIVFRFPETDGD